MEYNTERNHLTIPEYGRNIQKMIEHTCKITDREERNKAAQTIVAVMGTLNPHLRDITDFKHKLWDHLFIISDFKLDVDSPYPMPSAQTFKVKPKKVPYPKTDIKYKYYGKTMELMVHQIGKMEEGPGKEQLIQTIANFMKLQYLSWNRDTVDDTVIFEHLKELSKNGIEVKDSLKLQETFAFTTKNAGLSRSQKKTQKKRKGGRR
ncbi:MAG: DUF4290 domain-containing protein [Bacteroidia bacterium]